MSVVQIRKINENKKHECFVAYTIAETHKENLKFPYAIKFLVDVSITIMKEKTFYATLTAATRLKQACLFFKYTHITLIHSCIRIYILNLLLNHVLIYYVLYRVCTKYLYHTQCKV